VTASLLEIASCVETLVPLRDIAQDVADAQLPSLQSVTQFRQFVFPFDFSFYIWKKYYKYRKA
jgi:hypothetical protein